MYQHTIDKKICNSTNDLFIYFYELKALTVMNTEG